MDLSAFLALYNKVDKETALLLMRFVERARQQPDTNAWLKRQLKLLLDEDVVILQKNDKP